MDVDMDVNASNSNEGQKTFLEDNDKETSAVSNKNPRFKDRWKNPEYRRNAKRTIWLGASFWGLGFAIGQRGPAFLDLQIITQTNVEEAAFFFTSGALGYLVGSLVAGVIYDKLNKNLLFLLCVLGMAIATIILPWCSIYAMMIAIHFIAALFGGSIDTAGNAELVRIWGKEGEMAMQFIHFAFALGGVIGPLATEPFLTPTPEDDANTTITTTTPSVNNFTSASLWNLTASPNITDNSTAQPLPLTTDVHYAFLISGSLILLITIPLTVQLFSDRARKRRQDKKDEKKNVKQPLPLALFVFILGTLCLFYYLYCCVEDTFAGFLLTFVVKQLHWSKSKGAELSSVFWASFAVGRFLCIFIVHVLNSVKLLTISGLSLVVSMMAFLLFSLHAINEGVWVSTVFAGLSMAAIFPSGFTWMEEELVKVTGRVASSILISSSLGTVINPIVLGSLMQNYTPMWFAYLLFGEAALCFCIFLFLLAVSRLYLQKHFVIQEKPNHEITVPSFNGNEQALQTSTA